MPDTVAARLQLPQELTYRQARACLTQLRALVASSAGGLVELDAHGDQVFDSSALAVVLALRRAALQAGKQLRVQGLPPGLQSMAVLYGIDDLLAQEQKKTA